MNVLAISGSPRRGGNTSDALKKTLETLKAEPGVEVEFLQIADYRIEHCRGCRHCMTHIECAVTGDHLNLLVGKIDRADLVILGAPIYWWGPPGILKDFIDRTHAFYPDKRRFKGKTVAVITVAASSGFTSHERIMKWLKHYGADYVGWLRLFATEKGDLVRKPSEMEKIEKFAALLLGL